MIAQSKPVLDIRDIHKRFYENEVLKGVSVTAYKGDVISILGSSGSGKSTLLRCINFLEYPNAGRILISGEEISVKKRRDGLMAPRDQKQLARLRTRLGFVFQSFNLWPHMTILENVAEAPIHVLGITKFEAHEQAHTLLEKVGIADKHDHYPAQLSGGQQQRAAIARALAMEPETIMFDEPTSALDPELRSEVLAVMRALADEGRTMLIVTHEMGFARHVSTKAIFLHDGKVEEEGPPAQVFDASVSKRVRRFMASHLR